MKRVNMTMLARNAKTVVAEAVENPTVIITPGDKEDMILISETYFNSLKVKTASFYDKDDKIHMGVDSGSCGYGDSHLQEDLLK